MRACVSVCTCVCVCVCTCACVRVQVFMYMYVLLSQIFYRKFIHVLALIQVLPLFLTGIGIFATSFANHTERNVPTVLTAGIYFTLSTTAGPYVAYQSGFVDQLKQYWWKFVIIGLSHFYGTYLQMLAYSYISLSSNQVF